MISGLDRCESISGHFPAASPAPLALCVQGTQPLLPAQQRHSVAVSHTFVLWSLSSSREEGLRETGTLCNSVGAEERRGHPHAGGVSLVGSHGAGRARVGTRFGRGQAWGRQPEDTSALRPTGPCKGVPGARPRGRRGPWGNPAYSPAPCKNVHARPEGTRQVLAE